MANAGSVAVVQDLMWRIGKNIGDREGRMDVCIAAAGSYAVAPGLTFAEKDLQDVSNLLSLNPASRSGPVLKDPRRWMSTLRVRCTQPRQQDNR